MSLKGRLSQEFAGRIRDRGFAYFRTNAVEILEHSESHVDARVKGTEIYLVRLTLGRVSLDVACTCPYFEGGEECKHIWATMLTADSRQYLTDASLVTRLSLVLDYVAAAELREDAHTQRSLASNRHDARANRLRSTSPHKDKQAAVGEVKTTQEPEPSWRRQLSLITNSVRANPVSELDDWSAGRETG